MGVRYKFQWKGTKKKPNELIISENDMEHLEVYNQKTDIMGAISYVDNRLAILWADGSPNTYLDTDEGSSVLLHCKPY